MYHLSEHWFEHNKKVLEGVCSHGFFKNTAKREMMMMMMMIDEIKGRFYIFEFSNVRSKGREPFHPLLIRLLITIVVASNSKTF